MKVLITGKNGQVGNDLVKSAPKGVEVFAFGHTELDITSKEAIAAKLAEIEPDWVINAAAYTAVDKAEKESDKAFQANAIGPGYLAAVAREHAARLVHLSTDFVFDGNKNTPYRPEDALKPVSIYGKSKAEGERLVRERYAEGSILLRTSWVYSITGHNFVKTMLNLMKDGHEIRVVADQIGAPSWSKNLALTLWAMVTNHAPSGVYHWSDMGVASWYDFAVAIAEEAQAIGLIERDINVLPIATEQYPTAAIRPAYSVLDSSATRKLWGVKSEHWRKALRRMLIEYKKLHDVSGQFLG